MDMGNLNRKIWPTCSSVWIVLFFTCVDAPACELYTTIESVIEGLSRLENQVVSCDALYEIQCLPTQPDMELRIREYLKQNGAESELNGFIYGQRIADKRHAICHWSGKSEKEIFRWLDPKIKAERLTGVFAFDGLVVRKIGTLDDKPMAWIQTTQGAAWGVINRISPFSMIYKDFQIPFSQWVRSSPRVDVQQVQFGGRSATRVSYQMFNVPDGRNELILDEFGRQVRRRCYDKFSRTRDKEPRLCHVYDFTDYREFPRDNGESIWFPMRTLYTYVLGETPQGEPITYFTHDIRIHRIAFNIDIPDSEFVPELPPGVPVQDEVTGLGKVPPPDPVRLWKDGPARPPVRSHIWWWLAGIFAAVLTVIAAWTIRTRLMSRR